MFPVGEWNHFDNLVTGLEMTNNTSEVRYISFHISYTYPPENFIFTYLFVILYLQIPNSANSFALQSADKKSANL